MNLDDYRQPSPQRLRLLLSLFGMVVLSAVFGRARPGDLGTRGTLRRSAFARTMFADIGALGTLGALYLALTGKTRARVPGAVGTLFLGSFALLPALAYEDWKAMREQSQERRSA